MMQTLMKAGVQSADSYGKGDREMNVNNIKCQEQGTREGERGIGEEKEENKRE